MTLENILLDCKKQLNGALNHKKHPFRYFTLASISENDTPNLRTVVLREFNANKFQLSIFTDARSKKVKELKLNQNGKFLFYDSSRLIQLILNVKMIEIIDLNTLIPWDKELIFNSIKKTGKVLLLSEDTLINGFIGEISATISEEIFEYLDAPIIRVGSLDTPVPFSNNLEKSFLSNSRLKEKLEKLLKY